MSLSENFVWIYDILPALVVTFPVYAWDLSQKQFLFTIFGYKGVYILIPC